jgi:hypothetical protein
MTASPAIPTPAAKIFVAALIALAGFCFSTANAQQCLNSSQTGNNNGYW